MRFLQYGFLVLAGLITDSVWADATLTIKNNEKTSVFSVAQLLARSDVQAVTIPADVAYGKTMHYQALPLGPLLRMAGYTEADTVQFVALDGFAASLPARLVLASPPAAQAWLAIESSQAPWPALGKANAKTAGPFYLVWQSPEKSNIKQEQWPYQIGKIERVDSLEKRFPVLAPPATTPLTSSVWQGFDVYKTQCSVCHRLNGGGEGVMGPDLNTPMNPTRYFQPQALRKLIRNPAQVRTWHDAKMPAFSEQAISDIELDALISYLEVMAAP